MAGETELKITYYLKNNLNCPVCEREFPREELLSGGGRLIAGQLTDELRRLYEPSKKYGKINPLIYTIVVCPDCLFSSFLDDFKKFPQKNIDAAMKFTDRRVNLVMQTFGAIDFNNKRDEKSGIASYLLAINSYSFFEKNVSPTLKKGICALRAAWLFGDLCDSEEDESAKQKYRYIQDIMYKKAFTFYDSMLHLLQTGDELIDGVNLGPDTDKNWGYEGFLYIVGILQLKMGFLEKDLEKRAQNYLAAKRIISKLFGRGKASKSKPSKILDMSRDLYDQFSNYISEIEAELGKKIE